MDSTINDGVAVAPFLSKTYEMVDDPSSDSVVSWSEGNNSFIVWNVPEFQKELLPKYFKHGNFSSFVRQLNTYCFRKVDPDRYEFSNEGFLRGQKHLLRTISRKKHGNQPPQVQSSSIAACVEVGKFGLEEEVERLKRDKNVLMQELVRLRQQQQATDLQVQTVGQRVQVMELRQQQMMSFLAKAMQSPGFLGQLVQQQNESGRSISGGSKKRRLPKQNEENAVGWNEDNPSNGQIIKFHSSMNEAAKAMLHQILKLNSSSRLEPVMNNSTPLLLGNLSSKALDNGSSTSGISEVMPPKVSPNSGSQTFPAEPGFSGIQPSSAISESTPMVTDCVALNNFSGMSVQNPLLDEFLPGFSNMSETVPETASRIPTAPSDCDIGNSNCTNLTPSDVNLPISGENDAFPSDENMDILVDGIPRLPSINDAFWEQFLSVSPSSLDTDEINSSSLQSCVTEEPELQSFHENGWNKIQRLNDLAQQMELLASASRIS